MRIGILTFHRADNHGAVLQGYALQEFLKRLGYQPYVLDYRQSYIEFNISNLNAPISIDNKMGTGSLRQTVRSMIDFCIERDLQPVIVLPPLHPSLNKLLPSEFKQNYIYHFIDSVSTPGVKVLDYFDTPQFSVDEYFLNSYFMNKEGVKLFTKHVLKTLQQIEDL